MANNGTRTGTSRIVAAPTPSATSTGTILHGVSEVKTRIATPAHAPGQNVQAFDIDIGGNTYSVAEVLLPGTTVV